MDRERGLKCWHLLWFPLLLMHGATSSEERNKSCSPSRCGIITNISHPFRLRGDPESCGIPEYEIACENNVPLIHLYNGTYRVLRINYSNYTIRLVDAGIQAGNCSSLPLYSLSQSNFIDTLGITDNYDSNNPYSATQDGMNIIFKHLVYLNCSNPERDDTAYLDTAPCVNWESRGGGHIYAVAGDLLVKQLKSECRVKMVTLIALDWESLVTGGIKSYADIHTVISSGFEVYWWQRVCADLHCSNWHCHLNSETQTAQCEPETSICYSPMGITYDIGVVCRKLSKLRLFAEAYVYGVYKGLHQILGEGTYHQYDSYDFSLTNLPITLGVITGRGVFHTSLPDFYLVS